MKLDVSQQILEKKYPNIKFNENPSIRVVPYGRTDIQAEKA
jgi:hypothetical protein